PASARKELHASSLAYLPFVGLLLGCLLWLCAYTLDQGFYPAINALFIVSILTICTRGLPLGGLAGTLDGASQGGQAQEIGRIMRGNQRGTSGVIGICLAILAKYLLISQLIEDGALSSLLLFPTLGRWSMVCLVWFFPAALEKTFVGRPASRDVWWATAITLLCAILTQGLAGLGMVVLVWVFSFALGQYAVKRTGGITTQVMGAGVELVEILSLALVVGLQEW
ncbi:MAG: adenosylcobinamide-GDP ribazoletransferase, partial [Desulfobacterales bacterium]|nr:adenosylcobinamide-GDP ribazoletransferase [Desulfobacterales bacterium]